MTDPTRPCLASNMKRLFHAVRAALPVLVLLAVAPAGASALQESETAAAGEPFEGRPAAGTEDGRLRFEVGRAAAAPRIDGSLDEGVWASAAPIPLPFETAPGDNDPAPVRTRCFATFDDRALYFGCEAFDPDPDAIRAFITDRDDIGTHDRIIVSLDPFNDSRRAFEFSVSALGVQGDAVYDEQSGMADASWDAIWSSAGRVTQRGYVVELALPFRSLRFPDRSEIQTWGFHVRREWPRTTRVETRSMRWNRGDGCTLCQANLLKGIDEVSPGLNLQLHPTLTASRSDRRGGSTGDELIAGDIASEPGLDLHWGPTSDLSLNLTANPDFSQVEADAPQLDVNNRFALFFPEKRPFFLEGADFFATPLQAVFTRTVADPVAGTKVTGKLGPHALGAMFTLDRVNQLVFPGSQGSSSAVLDDEVLGAVARVRRDVGASSTIGGLYTGRFGASYANQTFGGDVFLRPLPALRLRAQALASRTRYPERTAADRGQPTGAFDGEAVRIAATLADRSWRLEATGSLVSPGFRADAGFVPQVDRRGVEAWGGRNVFPEDGFFSRLGAFAGAWHFEDFRGGSIDEGFWLSSSFNGPWQSDVWVNPTWSRRAFGDAVFDLFQFWAGGSIRPSGTVWFRFGGMIGDEIDVRNGRRGHQVLGSPALGLRLGRNVDLELSGSLQRMEAAGERVFTALVSQLRAVYNFTPRSFFRTVVQYRETDLDPATNPGLERVEERALAAQLLFSYKVNPLTVLFAGYSDDLRADRPVGAGPIPLTRVGRSFFVKLGYAWRP